METVFLVFVAFSFFMAAGISAYKQIPSVAKYRQRRSNLLVDFNDPKYAKQFHLNDKFGVTMNIRKAWSKGYTGKNVTICIHDPMGIWSRHDEFVGRFNLAASYNYVDNIVDPSPLNAGAGLGLLAHGSKMGGLAAAEANNNKCIVGVAYDAFISGVRLKLGSNKSDINPAADSLVYQNQINDIYSCSWGTTGNLDQEIGYMPPPIKNAVKRGAQTGRGGKGNIYVFANGNGGNVGNGTCGYDEYISSIYTISISVVTGKNVMSMQNVECTGVSAVTYARDGSVGVSYPLDLMPSCGNVNKCTEGRDGSSSAATAVASGIFALLLQANPNLGWRDVQHLVARCSSSGFPSVPWKTNKAGIRVSDYFGFGLLDADALIENAKNWTNVGPQLECAVDFKMQERIHGVDTTIKSVDLTTWPSSCGGESQRINFLEQVSLVVSFNYTLINLVEIEIEAPTGTKSLILRSGRRFDMNTEVKNLSILSLHHWGENPKGIWKMRLRNVKPEPKNSGYLFDWGLRFYGTKDDPLASNTIKPSQIRADFVNTTTKPPVTPKNTASGPISSTTPTVSGFWTKPNATTGTINGTTGTTRKVSTAAIKGNGSTSLVSCKLMLLACAILMSSLIWEDLLLRNAEG